MKKAIQHFSLFTHKKLMHGKCSMGNVSWCFNRAVAENRTPELQKREFFATLREDVAKSY